MCGGEREQSRRRHICAARRPDHAAEAPFVAEALSVACPEADADAAEAGTSRHPLHNLLVSVAKGLAVATLAVGLVRSLTRVVAGQQ